MSYVDALAAALDSVAIRGRRKARILTEISDHLRCDPDADLGHPDELARRFADELGTTLAVRAALVAFAALALAGVLFAVAFLAHLGVLRSSTDTARPFSSLAAALMVIGPQVALVAGSLGALRALRRREAAVISRAESAIIVRRAATGIVAGLASMAGFALMAVILGDRVPGWWTVLTLALSGAGAVALLAAAPSVLAAARLRPLAEGADGGLDADLGPLLPRPFRGHSWRMAIVVAACIAVVITAAGVVQSDPFDGALRGLADAGACLLGYLALGRFLGLRTRDPNSAAES